MNADEYSIARCISVLHRNCQCSVAKALDYTGIGSGQYGILMKLQKKGGVRQEELADFLKTDKGSIAKSVRKLEDEGYVRRSADEADGRAYRVDLTQKALDILPEVQRAVEDWEGCVTAGLDECEAQELLRLLRKTTGTVCAAKWREPSPGRDSPGVIG